MAERAEKGRNTGAELAKLLVDFKAEDQDPRTIVRSWKALAQAAGFSVKTVRRTLDAFNVKLPVWGAPGGSAPVFLPKGKLMVLRALIFRRPTNI